MNAPSEPRPFVRRIIDEYGLLALIIAAGLVIYGQRLLQPGIYWDDLDFLVQSRDLETLVAFLWAPHNEHLVPIWRLLTWAVYSAATVQYLSIAFNLVSIAGWAAVVVLLDRIAASQRVRPPFRQLGVALFAVSSVYAVSVAWYSGSQTMLALAALLASTWLLLKPSRLRLALAAGGGFVAVSIIATGALAVLILPIFAWRGKTRRPWLAPALVVTGVALYAVLYLTLIRDTVAQGPHAPAIDPAGLTVAARNFISSFFDVLILGSLGQIGPHPGVALWSKAIIAAALVGGLSYVAVRSKEQRKLIASGLIMIVGAWALIYTFRSWVPYDASVLWGRYHVFPLAGLALAGGAALQWMFGERLPRRPLWNVASVAGAAALLLLIHFAPDGPASSASGFPSSRFNSIRPRPSSTSP